MYNVPPDVTMLQLNMANWISQTKYGQKSMDKQTMLPRLLWVRKSITMKELHFQVFQTVR